MDEIVGAILGAVLGAALAGYLSYMVTVRATRINNSRALTIKLYEDWHQLEMLEARISTHSILKEYPQDSFMQLGERLGAAGRRSEWTQVSRVIHFFELVGMLLTEGQLDDVAFWRLFGRYVDYWRSEALNALISRSEREDQNLEFGWTTAIKALQRPNY